MSQHHPKAAKKENFDSIYYLVGLLSGLFVGVIVNVGFVWIVVGGVLGLLSAAGFVQVLAKSSEEA